MNIVPSRLLHPLHFVFDILFLLALRPEGVRAAGRTAAQALSTIAVNCLTEINPAVPVLVFIQTAPYKDHTQGLVRPI